MDLRKMTRYGVLIISVIAAAIVKGAIINAVGSLYNQNSYLGVIIDMVILVVVFVPLLGFAGDWVDKGTQSYVKMSKDLAKNRKKGFLIGFGIALLVLYEIYAITKFGIYPHKLITDLFG